MDRKPILEVRQAQGRIELAQSPHGCPGLVDPSRKRMARGLYADRNQEVLQISNGFLGPRRSGIEASREEMRQRVAFTTLTITSAYADDLATDTSKVTVVFDHTLPNVPGKSMKGILVESGPGGSSPAHTHPDSAFIYATVLEGAIRSSVNGSPEKIYGVGDSFYEEPGAHHGVSANASGTKPARLLAVFVVGSDEKELTTADK
jgi:quercetin dioxygenase-like cupin family protein